MCIIIFSPVACPAVQYFSTLSHNRHDFRKKQVVEYKMCFDFLYNFFLKQFSFWEKFSEILSQRHILVCAYSGGYFCKILIQDEFSRQILKKNSQMSNFMKTLLVGADLFHEDGRTDGRTDRQTHITKLTDARTPLMKISDILSDPVYNSAPLTLWPWSWTFTV